jgi:glycosyltransferase involved in cell wall biosynthesis
VVDSLRPYWKELGVVVWSKIIPIDYVMYFTHGELASHLYMLQNVTALNLLDRLNPKQVILRLGGIMITEETQKSSEKLRQYEEDISKVPAVISTNATLAHQVDCGTTPISIVPNGVDLEKFAPLPGNIAGSSSTPEFVVGFAGNISTMMAMQYKGYAFVSAAVTKLYPNVRIQTALHQVNQIPHVEMAGRFYHQIDCMINASIAEGCSNTIVEALACGVPVICTKVGYHGEMLEHGKHCFFINRTEKSVSEAICTLRDDPELRRTLSINGRKFAEKYHDIRNVASAYAGVFKQVLDRR